MATASETLLQVKNLLQRGQYRLSLHGFRKLAADDILLDDIVNGIDAAIVVEDYPDAQRGPSVLVLQNDAAGRPVHVVWGLPASGAPPAVLVTAYRPDPRRWSLDFRTRNKR